MFQKGSIYLVRLVVMANFKRHLDALQITQKIIVNLKNERI